MLNTLIETWGKSTQSFSVNFIILILSESRAMSEFSVWFPLCGKIGIYSVGFSVPELSLALSLLTTPHSRCFRFFSFDTAARVLEFTAAAV